VVEAGGRSRGAAGGACGERTPDRVGPAANSKKSARYLPPDPPPPLKSSAAASTPPIHSHEELPSRNISKRMCGSGSAPEHLVPEAGNRVVRMGQSRGAVQSRGGVLPRVGHRNRWAVTTVPKGNADNMTFSFVFMINLGQNIFSISPPSVTPLHCTSEFPGAPDECRLMGSDMQQPRPVSHRRRRPVPA